MGQQNLLQLWFRLRPLRIIRIMCHAQDDEQFSCKPLLLFLNVSRFFFCFFWHGVGLTLHYFKCNERKGGRVAGKDDGRKKCIFKCFCQLFTHCVFFLFPACSVPSLCQKRKDLFPSGDLKRQPQVTSPTLIPKRTGPSHFPCQHQKRRCDSKPKQCRLTWFLLT